MGKKSSLPGPGTTGSGTNYGGGTEPLLNETRRREIFLGALREGLSPGGAATRAGVARSTAYRFKADDEVFSKQWDDAVEFGTDRLEEIAWQRAEDGSDTLLIFMLKGRRREKYAERREVTGKDGGPVQYEDISEARDEFTSRIAGIASRIDQEEGNRTLN